MKKYSSKNIEEAIELVAKHRDLKTTMHFQKIYQTKQPFAIFICKLLSNYNVSSNHIKKKIKKIIPLVNYIQLLDEMIDREHYKATRAQIVSSLISLPWHNTYSKKELTCISKGMAKLSKLFKMEDELLSNTASFDSQKLKTILNYRNADFELYLCLCDLTKYSPKSDLFFRKYNSVDLILDDFADLLDDLLEGSFNFISWMTQKQIRKNLPFGQVYECLQIIKSTSIYDDLSHIAEQKIEKLLMIANDDSPLLKIAQAEQASLQALKQVDYLADPEYALSDEGRHVRLFITKPHPWERSDS